MTKRARKSPKEAAQHTCMRKGVPFFAHLERELWESLQKNHIPTSDEDITMEFKPFSPSFFLDPLKARLTFSLRKILQKRLENGILAFSLSFETYLIVTNFKMSNFILAVFGREKMRENAKRKLLKKVYVLVLDVRVNG